jgi:hypothetical protein
MSWLSATPTGRSYLYFQRQRKDARIPWWDATLNSGRIVTAAHHLRAFLPPGFSTFTRIFWPCCDCNVDAQSVSRQRLDKRVPVNTQQWKLCSLWAMLQLDARWRNTADNGSDWFSMRFAPRPLLCNGSVHKLQQKRDCFLCGPYCGYITRAVSCKFRVSRQSVVSGGSKQSGTRKNSGGLPVRM